MQAIAALLTPPGRAAVAVVSIASDNPLAVEQVVDQLFTPHGKLGKARPFSNRTERDIVYGIWDASQEDLVVVRMSPAATGTLQSCLEIHCHGGQVAAEHVTGCLAGQGVSIVSAVDYARKLNQRWSVESEAAICQTETHRTLGYAIRVARIQRGFLDSIKEKLPHQLALETCLGSALQWADFGKHLIEPRSIVLFGKPNVGKSSLINRLVGFQRVIVNPQAGTTRDVVGQKTAIGGWPVMLKDTAGIRDSNNEIEAIGIAKAQEEIESADLKIAICDASETAGDQWQATLAYAPDMVVWNKVDLLSDVAFEELRLSIEQCLQRGDETTRPEVAFVSAEQGMGMDQWIDQLGQKLVPQLPAEDQWFPITDWQRETLQCMQDAVEQSDFKKLLSMLDL